MQRNTERCCGSGKLFWKEVVGKGDLISSETVMITVVLPQQLGLQIRAEDVSIRVQKGRIHVPGDISRETIQSFEASWAGDRETLSRHLLYPRLEGDA